MRASVALCLALLSAACTKHDVETHPFHLQITLPDGTGLEQSFTAATTIGLSGTARRQGDTTMVLQGATIGTASAPVDATISFRADASPGVAFPPQLDGAPVTVIVHLDPAQRGPGGEPLPLLGLAISTGTDPNTHYQFLLAELPPPPPASLVVQGDIFVIGDAAGDVPYFEVIGDAAEFEPARCGAVYYDVLRVYGTSKEVTLRHGEQDEMPVGAAANWKVRHVVSWHRDRACAGQVKAWTQFAAWR